MRHFSLFLILAFFGQTWAQKVDIVLWHSLAGNLGLVLQQVVDDFNHTQKDYVIKPVYKGEYSDAITSFAAAFKAKQPPALIQVFEVGTGTMLAPAGIIKPLHELMAEQNQQLPTENFLPALVSFYSYKGKLQALPFNTSIPVIFYNADVLASVGINDKNFPATWDELENLAILLKKKGYQCTYTSAYPAWILIEAFSALHGLPLFELAQQKAVYNNTAIIRHLERLRRWQKKHYFDYGGRASDATSLFTSGKCVMYSQSSGSYKSVSKLVNFRVGVAALPLDTSVSQLRYNSVNGGAALWAVAGQSAKVYEGIARFYTYLLKSQVQQRWYESTGYIPISISGDYAFINKNNVQPVLSLAQKELASTVHQRPFNLATIPQNQIRNINDEALEAIFAGIKTPKVAINDAVTRANFVLARFLRNTKP
ncbi:glycerol-3-phosphate-binding periplasmic protein precursor [Legionella busanensis]|uniref:sn-glycerol-3-phosphate-binding periplasmic protein UgpB n=1 Tax=Legionella busanensis TaxID=190655 RepID=A0A378JKS6_9GAMM|nr:extracellular solute-binding protein [Legionella busanensis]STX51794.1 glycerol-3-phosphate-binding periplasmic protein precursor [Legionella busanensis]